MKTHRISAALLMAGIVTLAGPARAAEPAAAAPSVTDPMQQSERFSKTAPLVKGGTFDLSNISGDIVITAGTGDQVVIEAVKRGRNAADFKEVTIEVTATANRIEVRTRYPEGRRNFNVSVDYSVSVPRFAAVIVKSISGNEKVSGLDGELRLNTISGTLTVASAGDVRSVKSISGDVVVQSSKSTGSLSASTVSGGVKLVDVNASDIQINTVSGDMSGEQIATARFGAKSISGNVTFGGPMAKGGRYELSSHSGDIKVFASDKMGLEVSASSFSGDITSDIVLTSTFGGDSRSAGRSRRMRQSVQGTFGDGSAVLQLNSFSGDIRIIKK